MNNTLPMMTARDFKQARRVGKNVNADDKRRNRRRNRRHVRQALVAELTVSERRLTTRQF